MAAQDPNNQRAIWFNLNKRPDSAYATDDYWSDNLEEAVQRSMRFALDNDNGKADSLLEATVAAARQKDPKAKKCLQNLAALAREVEDKPQRQNDLKPKIRTWAFIGEKFKKGTFQNFWYNLSGENKTGRGQDDDDDDDDSWKIDGGPPWAVAQEMGELGAAFGGGVANPAPR